MNKKHLNKVQLLTCWFFNLGITLLSIFTLWFGSFVNNVKDNTSLMVVADFTEPLRTLFGIGTIVIAAAFQIFALARSTKKSKVTVVMTILIFSIISFFTSYYLSYSIRYNSSTGELWKEYLLYEKLLIDLPDTPDGVYVKTKILSKNEWKLNDFLLQWPLIPLPINKNGLYDALIRNSLDSLTKNSKNLPIKHTCIGGDHVFITKMAWTLTTSQRALQ